MAQQGGNQNLPPSTLCRMGCGFYGNPMYDGMCSKCHKDALKRRQQTSSPTQMSGRVSPLATACSVPTSEKSATDSVSQTLESSAASVETGSPTVTTTPAQDKTKAVTEKEQQETESVASATSTSDDTPADQDRKPKKNRCHTCKKKVGLTGFACRCGGLFCGTHRYSDKHDCSFNYRELAQKEIRKSNPVVVAEKIQKI